MLPLSFHDLAVIVKVKSGKDNLPAETMSELEDTLAKLSAFRKDMKKERRNRIRAQKTTEKLIYGLILSH